MASAPGKMTLTVIFHICLSLRFQDESFSCDLDGPTQEKSLLFIFFSFFYVVKMEVTMSKLFICMSSTPFCIPPRVQYSVLCEQFFIE